MLRVLNIKVNKLSEIGPPESMVYIGRGKLGRIIGSDYANPFIIGVDGTREEVISKHKKWLDQKIEKFPNYKEDLIKELHGKHLVCHCAPQACHGDYLLEIANG